MITVRHKLHEEDVAALEEIASRVEFQAARVAANVNMLASVVLVIAFGVAVYLSLPRRGDHASD